MDKKKKRKTVIALVFVSPKEGFANEKRNDNLRKLHLHGFNEVEGVIESQLIELKLEVEDLSQAGARVRQMCEKLLCNKEKSDYRFEIVLPKQDGK